MKIKKTDLDRFKKAIDKAETVSICSHISPDGDAIGSSMGLYYVLKKMGKKVYLVDNGDYPSNLLFMKNRDIYYEGKPIETDLFILTDVASDDRAGQGIYFKELAKNSLCIDHHRTSGGYCNENIIYSEASSTCEILANFFNLLSLDITPISASFLYLGMLTDSNRFQYESTTSDTLRIAAFLLDKGADMVYIHNSLYENLDANYLQLQAYTLKNAFYNEDKTIAIAKITKKDLDKFNISYDRAEGLVSILKSVSGIELACLIKEDEEDPSVQKLSFRSKTSIDVSEIAKSFGGGGHIRASGATLIDHTNEEAYRLMLERLL